ncbi:MAG TPA: hypothetical protein VFU47_14010, partial [Armatimonadota bacterium]|nr:hypothetical protein [Armatimonadota bacterium]
MSTNNFGPLSTAARAAETLTDRQQAALRALLSGATQAEAAQQSGAGERSIRRWLRDPAFRVALQQARCDLWTETTTRLQQACARAVDTLLDVMEHAPQASARVQAAKVVLQYSARAIDLEAVCGRADELEYDMEAHLQELLSRAACP